MLSRMSGLIGCSLLLLPSVTEPAEEVGTPNSNPQNRNEREKPYQKVVRIPPGTYPLDDIVTKGGTAERWASISKI